MATETDFAVFNLLMLIGSAVTLLSAGLQIAGLVLLLKKSHG